MSFCMAAQSIFDSPESAAWYIDHCSSSMISEFLMMASTPVELLTMQWPGGPFFTTVSGVPSSNLGGLDEQSKR